MLSVHQAIEEEGGDPDEIVIAADAGLKKPTPKRTARGNGLIMTRTFGSTRTKVLL